MALVTRAYKVNSDLEITAGNSDSATLSLGDLGLETGVLTGGGFSISGEGFGNPGHWRINFNGPSPSSTDPETPEEPTTWIVSVTNQGTETIMIETVYIVVLTDE